MSTHYLSKYTIWSGPSPPSNTKSLKNMTKKTWFYLFEVWTEIFLGRVLVWVNCAVNTHSADCLRFCLRVKESCSCKCELIGNVPLDWIRTMETFITPVFTCNFLSARQPFKINAPDPLNPQYFRYSKRNAAWQPWGEYSVLMNGFKRPLLCVLLPILDEPLTGLVCCLSNTHSLICENSERCWSLWSHQLLFCHFWTETSVFRSNGSLKPSQIFPVYAASAPDTRRELASYKPSN